MAIDVEGLRDMRADKDEFFRKHAYSPLTPAQRIKFTGLSYYEPNAALVLEVQPELFENQERILIQTNRDELRPFVRYGTLEASTGTRQTPYDFTGEWSDGLLYRL